MNCKPGDLAVIAADDRGCPSKTAGRIVEVLYASPVGNFVLPDGHPALGGANAWVVKLQSPMTVRTAYGTREALYVGCPDSKLRPIRPHGDDEEDQRFAPKPVYHEVTYEGMV